MGDKATHKWSAEGEGRTAGINKKNLNRDLELAVGLHSQGSKGLNKDSKDIH